MGKAPRNDAVRKREQGSRSPMATVAGCLLLAMGLALLAGCATGGKARVATAEPPPAAAETSTAGKGSGEPAGTNPAAAQQQTPPMPTGPSVVRFTDGREGFVIREPSGMDAQSRADFDLASAMIRDGKHDKAIELLEKVSAQSPEMTAPRINLAIAYGRMSKPEQAEQHLKKALESIPGHPVASNEYGLLLRKAGRFAESRQIYEKSLAIFPEYYPVHKNLGILCDLYLKDPVCAVEHYEIYGNAVPRDQQVKLWLADLQTRSGRNLTASAGIGNGTAHP